MLKRALVAKSLVMLLLGAGAVLAEPTDKPIQHDAEYIILEAQNGERWRQDDKVIDAKLAELRKNNGGKPPNIVYILLDDVVLAKSAWMKSA